MRHIRHVPGPVPGDETSTLAWNSPPESLPTTVQLIPSRDWIPGDLLRFRVEAMILVVGNGPHPADGTIVIHWDYRTTYAPEPSAALSLPIGVLGLAGLAAMKRSG